MTQWIATAAISVLMAAFMPTILLPQGAYKENALIIFVEEPEEQKETIITIGTDVGVIELPLEEYIVGVVLSEMPASFHLEALKAQAVSSRTFSMLKVNTPKHDEAMICADSACCQAWCSTADAKQKYSASDIEKVRQAVLATTGEYLSHNGDPIEAVFFSCSGGKTEAAAEVWGSDVPYLQSVESTGEEKSSKFISEKGFPLNEFKRILFSYDELIIFSDKHNEWVKNIKRTKGGGVDTIEICGRTFCGTELRKLFALNSTAFDLAVNEDSAIFKVKGYGHRVGMSQYGANAMAYNGASYRDILHHYYQGVEICK